MVQAERLIWLDCLRLFAGVSMVVLHASSDPHGLPWPSYPIEERWSPLLLRAVVYTARTELFILISVFLLLLSLDRRPRSYKLICAEQAQRLLIPFVFWTVFFAIFTLVKAQMFGYGTQAIARLGNVENWVSFFILGNVKYHMHFLPTLFGILLFFPLFQIAKQHPIMGGAVLLCLLIRRELDGFVYEMFQGTDVFPYLLRAIKILCYVGYGMVAGAALGIWQKAKRNELERWLAVIIYLGSLLFVFKLIATWKTVSSGQWAFDYGPGYWADFLMPVVLFGVCFCLNSRRWPRGVSTWGRYSFGIYLCHPIFLDIAEIALLQGTFLPVSQVALKVVFALPMSMVLVVAISKFRPIAWTIGLGPLPSIKHIYQRQRRAS